MGEESFADRLKRLCSDQGSSLEQLAEKLGRHRNTLTNRMNRGMTPEEVDDIAQVLFLSNVDTKDLHRLAAKHLSKENPRRETYLKALDKQYRSIQLVIGRNNKFPIHTIFQSLEFKSNTQKLSRMMTTSENLNDELYRDRGKRVVVLGNAGSGKTTFLKYLLANQVKRAINDYTTLIPIFIDLTWLTGSDKTVQGSLSHVVNTLSLSPGDEIDYITMLSVAIKEGRAFVCLDGLDEVATSQKALIDQIPTQMFNSTCIISSRTASFKEEDIENFLTSEWRIWELRHLTLSQQQNWASRLLPEIQQISPNYTKREPTAFISALNDPKIAKWGENPLLFNLALVKFAETGMLPENKHELYKSSIDGIRKGLKKDSETPYEQLGALALELFLQRKGRIFDKANIKIHIKKWGWNNDNITKSIIESGVLDIVSTSLNDIYNTYRFLHPTFQEYLAAKFIAEKPEMQALEQIDCLLKQIDDSSCRQVLIELAYMTHEKSVAQKIVEEELKETVAQVTLNEDILYKRLITVWKELKEEYQRQDAKSNPAATGISYVFEDLLNLWGDKLCTFLINGNPSTDGSVASSIAQVIERSSIDRSFAVPALIAGMHKYNNKYRFIGALGKIRTEEAIEGLLDFLGQTIEQSNDSEVRKRLIRVLGNHTEKVGFLLQNLPGKGQYSAENKRKALQELQELHQEKSYTLEELKEVLIVVDKDGKPSDWQSIEEIADWLQHGGLRNAMIQEHLLEIIKMLEIILTNHKTHYGRNAASSALGEIGNKPTFALMIRILENGEEKYEETVKVILSSLRRLTDRHQLDLHLEQSCAEKFTTIQKVYPTLAFEVKDAANYICQQFDQRA